MARLTEWDRQARNDLGCLRMTLQMYVKLNVHLVSAQPQELSYAAVQLATAQFSGGLRLLGSLLFSPAETNSPQWLYAELMVSGVAYGSNHAKDSTVLGLRSPIQ